MPALKLQVGQTLTLCAGNAAELMTPNPVSIRANATVREALALLLDHGYSAAPVIDDAGRPLGVLSRSDLLIHDREVIQHLAPMPEFYHRQELETATGEK